MSNLNLSAALFRNERKESPNQPDFTGPGSASPEVLKAMYEAAIGSDAVFDDRGNIKIRVAGWKKESNNGKSYISLSISLDRPPVAATSTPVVVTPSEDGFPF